jgi:hypothetical protein
MDLKLCVNKENATDSWIPVSGHRHNVAPRTQTRAELHLASSVGAKTERKIYLRENTRYNILPLRINLSRLSGIEIRHYKKTGGEQLWLAADCLTHD